MLKKLLFVLFVTLLLPASASAITFTSDATITNHDYGNEQVVVVGPAKVTFDNVTFGAFNATGATYEGRLSVIRGGEAVVTNSKFGPGGCSDGIQVSGGGGDWGIITVKNSEFVGLRQGSCGPHVDAIQFYGGHAKEISSNYVHDVSTGVMSYDSNGQIDVFKNNVLIGDEYTAVLLATGQHDGIFSHNVVLNKALWMDGGHNNDPPTGNVVKDNVADWINIVGGSGNTVTNNLTSGQVTFTGGTGRCAYATASPQGTATDGTNIGLNDCGGPPPPPPSPQCSDGVDNSDPEDTLVDYPADPGCSSATDDDETDPAPPPPPPTVNPPTFQGEAETAWSRTSSTSRAVSFSAQAGDTLIAYGGSEDATYPVSISGGTWNLVKSTCTTSCPAGFATAYVWTRTVTGTGTVNVTFNRTGSGTAGFGGDVLRFSGSTGVGASNKVTNANSLSLTTTKDNSAIVKFLTDWNAIDGFNRNSLTSGVGSFTEKTYALVAGAFTVYGGYHANVGAIGSKTIGYNAPSGMKPALIGAEVKGA